MRLFDDLVGPAEQRYRDGQAERLRGLEVDCQLVLGWNSKTTKPVTLPPGRGKLATKPEPTGSATVAKTMGMVRVCCRSAAVVGVVLERMRSGCSATSSFANRSIDSASAGVAQRVSIRVLRPSFHPS